MRPESLPNSPHLSILSDQPADEDQLNFAPYANKFFNKVMETSAALPIPGKPGRPSFHSWW